MPGPGGGHGGGRGPGGPHHHGGHHHGPRPPRHGWHAHGPGCGGCFFSFIFMIGIAVMFVAGITYILM